MGVLKHLASGRTVVLASHFVVGRDPASGVHLAHHEASNTHATLEWAGGRWEIRDHHSTNTTQLGGRVLPPGEYVPLARGSILWFGCDEERWELVDDSGPFVVARLISTGQLRPAENDLLALPDPDNVLLSIVLEAGDRWMAESPDGTRREVKHAERLELGDQIWELLLPPVAAPRDRTMKVRESLSVSSMRLVLHVSRTADHVHADVIDGSGKTTALGERACFYLLSVLAEERLKEAQAGELSELEQGWYDVPSLCTHLRMEEKNLNVTVFRARDVFGKANVEGAEGIIERRYRQMRIGTGNVKVIKA